MCPDDGVNYILGDFDLLASLACLQSSIIRINHLFFFSDFTTFEICPLLPRVRPSEATSARRGCTYERYPRQQNCPRRRAALMPSANFTVFVINPRVFIIEKDNGPDWVLIKTLLRAGLIVPSWRPCLINDVTLAI